MGKTEAFQWDSGFVDVQNGSAAVNSGYVPPYDGGPCAERFYSVRGKIVHRYVFVCGKIVRKYVFTGTELP